MIVYYVFCLFFGLALISWIIEIYQSWKSKRSLRKLASSGSLFSMFPHVHLTVVYLYAADEAESVPAMPTTSLQSPSPTIERSTLRQRKALATSSQSKPNIEEVVKAAREKQQELVKISAEQAKREEEERRHKLLEEAERKRREAIEGKFKR